MLFLALTALLALVLLTYQLLHLVARDGAGTNPLPRSHREETGSWIEQQLRR